MDGKTENIRHPSLCPELRQQPSVRFQEGRHQCFLVNKIMTPEPQGSVRPGGRSRSPGLGLRLGKGAVSSQAAFCQADNCELTPTRKGHRGSLPTQAPDAEPGRASGARRRLSREGAGRGRAPAARGPARGSWVHLPGAEIQVAWAQGRTQGWASPLPFLPAPPGAPPRARSSPPLRAPLPLAHSARPASRPPGPQYRRWRGRQCCPLN